MSFARRYSTIDRIKNSRRLPRASHKIRLGYKTDNGGMVELPFFLLPDAVARVHGNKVSVERAKQLEYTREAGLKFISENLWRLAEELPIRFPVEDMQAVAPQSLRLYGKTTGLKCEGDGTTASYYDETKKVWKDGKKCPCKELKTPDNPTGHCTEKGNLMACIEGVSLAEVYQIDMGSANSMININSGLQYAHDMIGRFALVPMLIRRVHIVTHHDNKPQSHWPIQLLLHPQVDIVMMDRLRGETNKILALQSKFTIEEPEIETNPAIEGEIVSEEVTGVVTEEEKAEQAERDKLREQVIDLKKTLHPDTFKKIREKYPEDLSKESLELNRKFVDELKEMIG